MPNQEALEKLADDLLVVIRSAFGRSHSIEKLGARFQTSTSEVDTALNTLQLWGYKLKRSQRDVSFVAPPDLITATEIAWQLKTKWLGKNIHAYQSVKSTNDIVAALAESGAKHGMIVTAEEQTQGRGRFTRTWHSPRGRNIYLSAILRPSFPPERAPGMSIMTAVALAETIEHYCPGAVHIKWPNDVLIHGKKTAGILTELSADRGKISHVIVGVGINVNLTANEFPDELRASATSIRRASRKKVDRVELLRAFLLRLEKRYEQYSRDGLKPMHKIVREYSSLIGHDVTLLSGRKQTTGLVIDIDDSGSLVLKTSDGVIAVSSGEVTVAKKSI